MRAIISLGIILTVFACQGTDRATSTEKEAAPAAPVQKPTPKKASAEERAAAGQATLEAFRAMKRARAYELEGQASVPGVLSAALGHLRPVSIPFKTVRAEAFRAMKLLKHTPGHAQYKLRLVTTVRGGDLRTALEGPLRSAGWLGANMTLRTPLKRADGSVLEVKLMEPDERPTIIDFVLTAQDPATPMETPSLLLSKPPLWPAVLGEVELLGYEFGHFHGTRPGGAFTDLERSAVLYGVKNARARVADVERKLLARGFTRDDDGKILRGPGGASLVIKADAVASRMLVHYQRRWTTPSAVPPKKETKSPVGSPSP